MTVNTANAKWQGDLQSGNGEVKFGTFKGQYTFKSRFEGEQGTNPEELIAAAHAACFSMAFSNELNKAGFKSNWVQATANVTLGKDDTGFGITQIELVVDADVPGIAETKFQEIAEAAKVGCPISKALAAVKNITLKATLQKQAA
jgi:lipoyl-dependent peroxiredoxin